MTKKKINRAGIIPYHVSDNGDIHMLFMRPSDPKYGTYMFQLLKGKVEDGETALEAAIREGGEEGGLIATNIIGEPHHLGRLLGRTDVFVCEVFDKSRFGSPTTPEEVESTKWMTPEEFNETGRELHKSIIKAAVEYIQKQTIGES